MTDSQRRVPLDATRELAFLRAQRERAAALITERQRRTDALRTRLRVLEDAIHRALGSLVTLRLLGIRQRHRAGIARLVTPCTSRSHGAHVAAASALPASDGTASSDRAGREHRSVSLTG